MNQLTYSQTVVSRSELMAFLNKFFQTNSDNFSHRDTISINNEAEIKGINELTKVVCTGLVQKGCLLNV